MKDFRKTPEKPQQARGVGSWKAVRGLCLVLMHGCAEMCGGLVHGCASGSCAEMCEGLVHGWLCMAARVGEEMFEDSGFPLGRKGCGMFAGVVIFLRDIIICLT